MQATDKLEGPATLTWSEQDLVCVKVALEMARQHWRDLLLADDHEPEVLEMMQELLTHAEKMLANIDPHVDRLRRRDASK